jgi:hypothetical protein
MPGLPDRPDPGECEASVSYSRCSQCGGRCSYYASLCMDCFTPILQANARRAGEERKKYPPNQMFGVANPSWKGNKIKSKGHHRAQKRFKVLGTCEEPGCEVPAVLRHHKDGNPKNNIRGNLEFLCRKHHGRRHVKA